MDTSTLPDLLRPCRLPLSFMSCTTYYPCWMILTVSMKLMPAPLGFPIHDDSSSIGARRRLGQHLTTTIKAAGALACARHCSEAAELASAVLYENMTPSKITKIHNVLQRRHRRTKPRPWVTRVENLVKFKRVIPENPRGQTDIGRYARRNTPSALPATKQSTYNGRVNSGKRRATVWCLPVCLSVCL